MYLVSLVMYDEITVHVQYTGSIRHPLCGQWARPIRTNERNVLRKQFSFGRKPYSVYVEKLNSKTGDELLAGNYDGIGKSKHVLRKLSSEAMHDLRLDPDVYASFLKLQANVHGEALEKFGIHSFVQSVSISPVVLHFWTENGVRLHHQLSCCNCGFP